MAFDDCSFQTSFAKPENNKNNYMNKNVIKNLVLRASVYLQTEVVYVLSANYLLVKNEINNI